MSTRKLSRRIERIEARRAPLGGPERITVHVFEPATSELIQRLETHVAITDHLHRSARVGFSRHFSWQFEQAVVIASAASRMLS